MPPSADRSDHSPHQIVSARTIHDVHASLTIIKAQAHMLRRWVHRSDVTDAAAVLARLDMIETMVSKTVSLLDERGTLTQSDPAGAESGTDPDGATPDRSRR
jgi:hypothetical protein